MKRILHKFARSVVIPAIFFSGIFTAYAQDVPVPGDLNKDGVCSVSDIILLRTYIMNPEKLPPENFEIADINGDESITVSDVVALRQIIMSGANKPRFVIEPASCVLTVDDTAILTAKFGEDILQSEVDWSSDNAEVATVDEIGVVKALSPGMANITAVWRGHSCTVQVAVCPKLSEGMYTIRSAASTEYLFAEPDDIIGFGTLQNADKYKFRLKLYSEGIVLETLDEKYLGIDSSEEECRVVISHSPQCFIPIITDDSTYILRLSDEPNSSLVVDSSNGLVSGGFDPRNINSQFVLNLIREAVVYNTGGEGLNVRKGPGTQYPRLSAFVENARVEILSDSIDGWYYVAGTDYKGNRIEGYCSGEFLKFLDNKDSVLLYPVRRDGTSTVTQEFKPDTHNGIDIASYGGAHVDILAAASGKVIGISTSCTHNYGKKLDQTFCYDNKYCNDNMGNYVRIDHGNGIVTTYMHLTDVYVKVGDTVQAGQLIGTMGSTGRSTGVHLHFEVRVDGVRVEPRDYLDLPGRYEPIC